MSSLFWEKRGCILKPDAAVPWLAINAGPCFARLHPKYQNIAQLYVSGRDVDNRSCIGLVTFDLDEEKVLDIAEKSVLSLGEKGAFDENGTSYPYIVTHEGQDYLYYTGWIQGIHVRWYNDLGLAVSADGQRFERLSRSPLPLRNNEDFIGIGSSCIIKQGKRWLMWYTRFDRWGSKPGEYEHYYNIKHAVSDNGITWQQVSSRPCIDFADSTEYAIAKPCVIALGDYFVMWYSYRGKFYRPGMAVSQNGVHWERLDNRVGIDVSDTGWDSEMLCYPFILQRENDLFMFYNGNGYGATGLGMARTDRDAIMEIINARVK